MKKFLVAVSAISFLSLTAFGQARPVLTANNHSTSRAASSKADDNASPIAANTTVANGSQTAVNAIRQPTPVKFETPGRTNLTARPRVTTSAPTNPVTQTQTYCVGVGDVLDIQIPHSLSTKSTLFTVMDSGLVDYPLAAVPISVVGLTTEAIAHRLRSSIKVLDNLQINVRVRDFASHTVSVVGFVNAPGNKVLRREAVPLYVVLSEAMPLPDAVGITVVRNGKTMATLDLRDANAMNQLVINGDIIKVTAMGGQPTEFFFVGGEVNAPGQKSFHSGLTLTQAILASGGTSRNADSIVRVSRQGIDGRLTTTEYNLRTIQGGKLADPTLQKGDRIEVNRLD